MNQTFEIKIDAPLEKVAALFSDARRRWRPVSVNVRHLDGEKGAAGERSLVKIYHNGNEIELIETVAVANLPGELSLTIEMKGVLSGVRNRFEAIDPDRTQWHCEIGLQTKGFLMKLVARMVWGPFCRLWFENMEKFKASAEGPGDSLGNERGPEES